MSKNVKKYYFFMFSNCFIVYEHKPTCFKVQLQNQLECELQPY